MKSLPVNLLDGLRAVDGFDRDRFVDAHRIPPPVSIRFNTNKLMPRECSTRDAQNTAPCADGRTLMEDHLAMPVPWTSLGYYLKHRPSFTFDPLFHAGCYYVQEASSMFLEQACRQLIDLSRPVRALDLCAAPGGKSTHLQNILSPESLIVCNDVIRPRSEILRDNIIRWGAENVVVTNNDPKAFQHLPGYFDLMIVDAPCSGSGLFRRDEQAIDEWSEQNVQLCSQRQQRILADALPALASGGILIYSTCSYSREEDELIQSWLVDKMGLQSLPLTVDPQWGIVEVDEGSNGYRFFPDKVKGEGFYLACFRKVQESDSATNIKPAVDRVSAKERLFVEPWIENKSAVIVRILDRLYSFSEKLASEFSLLKSVLNIRYAGLLLGELARNKMIPDHPLAMSNMASKDLAVYDLSREESIAYLQKATLDLPNASKGWTLITYKGFSLGWANVLNNRINNYYPKELRILKLTEGMPSQKI